MRMWYPNVAYNEYHGQRDYMWRNNTLGIWMNRLVNETNVDVDSSTASTSAPHRTRRANSRSRRTCVTTTLVVIVFVLLLLGVSCVPLILYFVEKDQYKYYKAEASITFEGAYNESLGDLSTQTSIDFQQDFCQVIEQTQAKKFKEIYSGCLVTQIKNGSIIVAFTMYYYAKETVQSDEVKSEITISLKTNLKNTFSFKFNITVDVNSLTVSLLQTGENDFQSGTSDSRFQMSLLTSTTEGTTSPLVTTTSSNVDNATTTEVTKILSDTTTTNSPATTSTAPLPETTTTDTPTTTTTVFPQTTTTDTPTTTTTDSPPETTTTDTPITTTTFPPPKTTITDTPTTTTTVHSQTTTTTETSTSTTTVPRETTTTDTPSTTTTVPPQTTITDTPSATSTAPPETTKSDISTTTTTVPPQTTITDTPTTTTTASLEIAITDAPTTTTTAPPETITTDISTTTTTVPPETTSLDTPASTTTAPPETTTTDISTSTTTISFDINATTTTIYSPTSATTVLTDINTTYPPITTETFSDTTIFHSPTTTTFINTSSDNDKTTATTTSTSTTATTTISAEPFAVVGMKNSVGEIGKQAYIPCTINITNGDWLMIYIYQTNNDSIEPKVATISKNETITVFTSDPLMMPTLNISGSQIEAVVKFNLSNFVSSKCSMRLYKFTCVVEMTTGITFNASAEFNLIAPLTQPTVILHGTRFLFNETANVSLAAINATCNTTRDRSRDIASTIAMRIQNASGADITSFLNVTSYNRSTETCGEFVFIHWSEVFPYRSDLNGSNLTCYVERNNQIVSSESITLTFLEQQNSTVSSTANPAITSSTSTGTTTQPDNTTTDIPYNNNYTQPSSTGTAFQDTTSKTSISNVIVTSFYTTTNNRTIITSTDISTTTTQLLSQPHAVVVMKNAIGEIGKQAYIPCTINITSGDWAMIYIYQTNNNSNDPKIATISSNGTITVFTSDPLLMPTFNISGSQIEAVVTFNFSNYDYSNCSVRQYIFICSVEMTTGSTFNASAEFNLIAPLTQPTVILHGTRFLFNETANVSLAAISATCNTTTDRYSDIDSTIAMRIQNVSGHDIDSFVDLNSYNISTETCGELVFLYWSEIFSYRSDLNGSSLSCYVETSDKMVTSEKINLTFIEQQIPP